MTPYNVAEGASCSDCGGTVGKGADGRPYARCFSCRNKRKNLPEASLATQRKDQEVLPIKDERQRIIVRESALKSAVEFSTPEMDEKGVLKLASRFEKWILDGVV